MGKHGRFEFERLVVGHPLAPLLGSAIDRARRIVWRDTDVGLELVTGCHCVVIANEADEVFVSNGPLPPDYADAARMIDA